jgi:hypothetical protein
MTDTPPTKRRFWRISLSTAVVAVLLLLTVIGGMKLLQNDVDKAFASRTRNVHSQTSELDDDYIYDVRGETTPSEFAEIVRDLKLAPLPRSIEDPNLAVKVRWVKSNEFPWWNLTADITTTVYKVHGKTCTIAKYENGCIYLSEVCY